MPNGSRWSGHNDPWKSGTKLDIVNLPMDSLMLLTDFLVNYMGFDNIKSQ